MKTEATGRYALTEQDLEVVRSFLLPIQLNIPLSDNPKIVSTVLLMAACGMIEHTHFGTPAPTDATFESDDAGYGMRLFQEVVELQGIEPAAVKYLRYLRTCKTDEYELPVGDTRTREEIMNMRPKMSVIGKVLRHISRWIDRNFGEDRR